MGMGPIQSFRDLDAWNVATELAAACYRLARLLPADERFELSAQIRRAAVSVPSNVAEGHATGSEGLFGRHVRTSLGSVGELETHMELAIRLGLLPKEEVDRVTEQLKRTGRVLQGLARSIRARRLRKKAEITVIVAASIAAFW